MSENPRGPTPPNYDPILGPSRAPSRTLVEDMADVVDDARQLLTDFGLRPYRAVIVEIVWSGGARGRGVASVARETELLPTPELLETSGVSGSPRSGGIAERGNARLIGISPRYTEDELHGLFGCGDTVAADREVFVEIRVDDRDGNTKRRRFIVTGVPYRAAGSFEWRVSLIRQDGDRSRSGVPYGAR